MLFSYNVPVELSIFMDVFWQCNQSKVTVLKNMPFSDELKCPDLELMQIKIAAMPTDISNVISNQSFYYSFVITAATTTTSATSSTAGIHPTRSPNCTNESVFSFCIRLQLSAQFKDAIPMETSSQPSPVVEDVLAWSGVKNFAWRDINFYYPMKKDMKEYAKGNFKEGHSAGVPIKKVGALAPPPTKFPRLFLLSNHMAYPRS